MQEQSHSIILKRLGCVLCLYYIDLLVFPWLSYLATPPTAQDTPSPRLPAASGQSESKATVPRRACEIVQYQQQRESTSYY